MSLIIRQCETRQLPRGPVSVNGVDQLTEMYVISQTEVECTCSAMQCTLQVHCSLCRVHTLPASGSVPAVCVQPRLQLHCLYTACTLHFSLGYTKNALSIGQTILPFSAVTYIWKYIWIFLQKTRKGPPLTPRLKRTQPQITLITDRQTNSYD